MIPAEEVIALGEKWKVKEVIVRMVADCLSKNVKISTVYYVCSMINNTTCCLLIQSFASTRIELAKHKTKFECALSNEVIFHLIYFNFAYQSIQKTSSINTLIQTLFCCQSSLFHSVTFSLPKAPPSYTSCKRCMISKNSTPFGIGQHHIVNLARWEPKHSFLFQIFLSFQHVLD
ncbi:hypothetical protein EGR_11145 [Echinococcus granulosus]|uniref:Uncharacterized protein n=1 Tax=Echinococcus granulosus TaxID=6210 RepID=W6UKI6_ECHGR|nr:hypothetical protein EGR_11145 [Echinococcus granulosus]EUB53999.1 hypothetical protein EGR_11145 [Echinococcus granulosus]